MSKTVDHRDRDPLNNRRSNLRSAPRQQQNWNRGGPLKGVLAPYRGVSRRKCQFRANSKLPEWQKEMKRKLSPPKWVARILIDGVQFQIGTFDTPEEASSAYETFALCLHGEFYYRFDERIPVLHLLPAETLEG